MGGLVGTIGSPREHPRARAERRGAGVRPHARVLTVLLALLALQLGSLVAPAYACACGALVAGDGRRLAVGREVSVVRWDGRQEQIVTSLRVGGDAERAAWIMPVPRGATVELGDAELFDQLAAATAPVQRTRTRFWPQDGDWPLTTGGGRGGPPRPPHGGGEVGEVSVVGRERLGPFDMARLTAADPAALGGWLSANGFALPARLETALRPYDERRWEYVAVKLAPGSAGGVLGGELQPLRVTFAADAPVYPMRLSRLAAAPQSLGLYVLAAHRMEPVSRIGGERPRVTFAGRVGASAGGPLGDLARGTPFLTAVAQEFPRPATISGDHELRRASADTTFRQEIYEDRLLRVLGIPVWLLTVIAGLLATAAVSITLALHRRHPHRSPRQGADPGGAPGEETGGMAGFGVGRAGRWWGGARAWSWRRAAPVVPPVPRTRPTATGAPQVPPMPTAARAPQVPPMATAHPTATGAPQVPPMPTARPTAARAPQMPPMPTAHPTATGVPPRPAAPPVPDAPPVPAVPPMPPMPPSPQAIPQPRAAGRHAQSAQRPQRSRRSQGSQWSQWSQRVLPGQTRQSRQSPRTPPPPPLRPPTVQESPAARPPGTPPHSSAAPKPFTLPVTPGPNG